MANLFGTDGVRGAANVELTPELALELGKAASLLAPKGERVVIGRDTRRSGSMLEAGLAAGMASVGLEVLGLGVIPTPAIPLLIREFDAALGVMVSASHNLACDNGIKFFTQDGFKIPPETERKLEEALNDGKIQNRAIGQEIGRIEPIDDALERYARFLSEEVVDEAISFEGLRIVVDCAHGATYRVAPQVLRRLGAEVVPINVSPTGDNINLNCGSTCLDMLKDRVRRERADLGVAYDGDGDRALFADHGGDVIDGDALMLIAALALKEEGRLNPALVVSTVMSNLGLEHTLARHGIGMIRTQVGDRYVAQKIEETGALLGGEQSGHIIFRGHSPTGDGLITTLKILEVLGKSGRTISQFASQMERYPQVLQNIEIKSKALFSLDGHIAEEVERWRQRLGQHGRILVRPSGTQPVVRVMVEGMDENYINQVARSLCQVISRKLNR